MKKDKKKKTQVAEKSNLSSEARAIAAATPAPGWALYQVGIQINCCGHPPAYSDRTAPEIAAVTEAAARAARRVIEDAGFTIEVVGHGATRTDVE